MYTHYFPFTQNPLELENNAKLACPIIKYLQDKYKDYNFCLVYQGMSGTSLATSVSLMYYQLYKEKLNMFYIRKRGEKCLSSRKIEYFYDRKEELSEKKFFIFMDDIIDFGHTYAKCFYELKDQKHFLSDRDKIVALTFENYTKTIITKYYYDLVENEEGILMPTQVLSEDETYYKDPPKSNSILNINIYLEKLDELELWDI